MTRRRPGNRVMQFFIPTKLIAEIALRINGMNTHAGIEDLHMLLECRFFLITLFFQNRESAAHLQNRG